MSAKALFGAGKQGQFAADLRQRRRSKPLDPEKYLSIVPSYTPHAAGTASRVSKAWNEFSIEVGFWSGRNVVPKDSSKPLKEPQKKTIRVLLERILDSRGGASDIQTAISLLRFASHCPQDVRDIGDFAAHRPAKDRGRLLLHTDRLYKNLRKHVEGKSGLTVSPAYTDRSTADSLLQYCRSYGIFRPSEHSIISPLVNLVDLYGLAMIHGCYFDDMDGSKETPLIIAKSGNDLQINCTVPAAAYGVKHPQVPQISFSMPVFATSVSVSRTIGRLNEDLVMATGRSDPNTAIEITADLNLQYLE